MKDALVERVRAIQQTLCGRARDEALRAQIRSLRAKGEYLNRVSGTLQAVLEAATTDHILAPYLVARMARTYRHRAIIWFSLEAVALTLLNSPDKYIRRRVVETIEKPIALIVRCLEFVKG